MSIKSCGNFAYAIGVAVAHARNAQALAMEHKPETPVTTLDPYRAHYLACEMTKAHSEICVILEGLRKEGVTS